MLSLPRTPPPSLRIISPQGREACYCTQAETYRSVCVCLGECGHLTGKLISLWIDLKLLELWSLEAQVSRQEKYPWCSLISRRGSNTHGQVNHVVKQTGRQMTDITKSISGSLNQRNGKCSIKKKILFMEEFKSTGADRKIYCRFKWNQCRNSISYQITAIVYMD